MVIPYHIPVTVSTTVRDPTLEMLLAELSGVPTDSCGQGNMVATYQLLNYILYVAYGYNAV